MHYLSSRPLTSYATAACSHSSGSSIFRPMPAKKSSEKSKSPIALASRKGLAKNRCSVSAALVAEVEFGKAETPETCSSLAGIVMPVPSSCSLSLMLHLALVAVDIGASFPDMEAEA